MGKLDGIDDGPTYPAGQVYDRIDDALARWMGEQPMFFVATAPLAAEGHVNVSPRGHDALSVLGRHQVGWVDYTGSGVETIAHLRENGRICSASVTCSPAAPSGVAPRVWPPIGRTRMPSASTGCPAYGPETADRRLSGRDSRQPTLRHWKPPPTRSEGPWTLTS